ncbi:hypothetical protein HDU98_005378 [Podochytrium sp. JEL0797]|nr:hypothetical protein HDU98_005378 [Podochytrium sp. JEL0797]
MDGTQRRLEIERKKAKIALLQQTRAERTALLKTATAASAESFAERRRQLEDLVASLVNDEKKQPPPLSEAVPVVTRDIGAAPSREPPSPPDHIEPSRKPAPRLAMASMVLFETPPVELVCYEKEQQTTDSSFQTDIIEEEIESAAAVPDTEEEPYIEPVTHEPTVPEIRLLNDAERDYIQQTWQFQEFFELSSKLVERALTSEFDTLVDYTRTEDDRQKRVDTGKGVKSVCTFFDDRWSKNRAVTDLQWSPRHPELLLASYNKNPASHNDPDGLLLIWNQHVPTRPEFMFHAPSDVTSASFSEFHPNLVVGGTYSGQILVWDNRAKSMPVLKTPLSAAGHTHPVYSLKVVGTQNAHGLVTCGTDGTVCGWQLDMLAAPQEIVELAHSPMDSSNLRPTNEIAVTCFGFPANETTTFWVGTEEGNVYQANRYDRAGGKAGLNPLDTYTGHDGQITSLDFHPLHGPIDFSDLFLTSSVDWTVKLWKSKSTTKSVTTTAPTHAKIAPVYSFDLFTDFVYDVKWSPVHPALFAAVDGSGTLSFVDLNQDVEVACASVSVGGQGKALNKVAWEKAGGKVGVGASDGVVTVVEVGEVGGVKGEEFVRFAGTRGEMGW